MTKIKTGRLPQYVIRNTAVRQIFEYKAPAKCNTRKSVKLSEVKTFVAKQTSQRSASLAYLPFSQNPTKLL